MRRKSVYHPDRPPEHLVSAIFDEPFDRLGITVLRWWYGDMFKEQAGTTAEFVGWYRERICEEDLSVMERKVWGCARIEEFNGMPPSPEFWKQVVDARNEQNVR